MTTKPFISLCFYQKALQILQLNTDKTAVITHATVPLPDGLIVHYRVTKTDVLSQILQQTWDKLNLTETSVGIVVPEFSTFTKSLFLPNIDTAELNEAVKWQSQEFMPSGSSDVVMDWKIVSKQKDNFQILAVAISQDVLFGYVDAASSAGLYPLVVETPSLSLERVANGEGEGKLVIYTNYGEAVLAFIKGKEIIGSSVISSANQDGILYTALQMVEHYSDVTLHHVYVGGKELTNKLLADITSRLQVKVVWLTPQITGMSTQEIQDYLIPVSLQKKNPAEPRDESTINLLPPVWAKQYENKRFLAKVWTLMIAVSLVIWMGALVSGGMYVYLSQEVSSLQGVVSQGTLPQNLASKVAKINALSKKIMSIQDASAKPQKIINTIMGVKTGNINLRYIRMNLDVGEITLRGNAKDREALIVFKQNLEENDDFSSVKIPLSHFEIGENIDFTATLVYVPSAPKKVIKLKIN